MKKLLSLALTLALCLGLAAPAMAADMPTEEELEAARASVYIDIDKFVYAQADKGITLYTISQTADGKEDTESATNDGSYTLISMDSVFTVAHAGEEDSDTHIEVCWDVLKPMEDGAYERRLDESYNLARDGFVGATVDPDEAGGLVELQPGEQIQFSMPTDEGIGDTVANMYILRVRVFFPKYRGYYERSFVFKVDEASIAEKYPPIQFTDVPEGEWYTEPVEWAVSNEITTGTTETKFAPDTDCTNAQILTFLWRAAGSPEPTISNPFTNINEDAYYYKAALWAYEKGMVEGDIFEVDTPCTRASSVKYIWQAAGSPKAAEKASFEDVPAGADYADAVDWALEAGVTTGSNAAQTMFSPDTVCTRAHIVTFLYRAFAD